MSTAFRPGATVVHKSEPNVRWVVRNMHGLSAYDCVTVGAVDGIGLVHVFRFEEHELQAAPLEVN